VFASFVKGKKMIKQKIIIKLGDSDTFVYKEHQNIVYTYPSKISCKDNGKKGKIYYNFGKNAQVNLDEKIYVEKLFEKNLIKNLDDASYFLTQVLKDVTEENFNQIELILILNCTLSAEERKKYKMLTLNVGIGKSIIVLSPVALGLGVEQKLSLIVNIGTNITEIAYIKDNQIVDAYSIELGGKVIDECIAKELVKNCSVAINEANAELIKKEVGSLYEDEQTVIGIAGIDVNSRDCKKVQINSQDIYPILNIFYSKLCEAIIIFLNGLSFEDFNDISFQGILITGGNSKISGIESFIRERVKINVSIVPIKEMFLNSCKKMISSGKLVKEIVEKN
jgi:rod shape-determining protein MreB and related proteins